MNNEEKRGEATLEQAIAQISGESVDQQVEERAAHRVWARISEAYPAPAAVPEVGQIRSCADFQALIPAYFTKTLPEARALLLQAHTLECVACRHALSDARSGRHAAAGHVLKYPAKPKRSNWIMGWAIAAVLLVGVGIGLALTGHWFGGTQAVVQSVDGSLYHVSDHGNVILISGGIITANQEFRTANASSAVVRLADGSLVEMSERADLWLSRSWRDTTIHLERGNIVVQAAKQTHGRLYVATRDCVVAVKGTIFAVDAGLKGARISVIQGEVEVTQEGRVRLLHPGEQLTTRAALAQVPVKQAVSWSRNSGEYLALLGELAGLEKQIEAIPGPPARYDSTLLKMVPPNTIFYAAIPNIGSTLSQANRLFQERVQRSEVLQQWWKQQQASGEAQRTEQIIDRISSFSDYLGDEIVVAMPADHESPLLLAEVRRTDFGAFLQGQLSQLNAGGAPPQVVGNPAALGPAVKGQPLILLRHNILAVATDGAQLQRVAALIDFSGYSGFVSTPFYAAIRQAYQGGAGWLLCADMEQTLAQSVHKGEAGEKRGDLLLNENVGLADMRYLIMESKEVGGETQNRATLTFSQERRGVASWLAAPSPMGTLDFVSPNASFAISFVAKEPRAIVQDILNLTQIEGSTSSQAWADFEANSGVSIQEDLAGSLGGEATFALDGPLLPTPSWKAALEVNDATRLQAAIEKLVTAINQQQAAGQGGHLILTQQNAKGGTFYELQVIPGPSSSQGVSPSPTDINYVYLDGYLLAAPNRALLLSSIQNRETGYSLPRSSDFVSRLPPDGHNSFSGLVYQNLWSAVAPIADQLKSTAMLTLAQHQAIDEMSQNSTPSLICAYGEQDQILVANTGSFFGLGFESLLGAGHGGPFSVLQMIESATRSAPKKQP
jgi:hypothetical protein